MSAHRHLLSPLDLRGRTLRNRIVFGAHTANMAEDGLPGARYRDYLRERALGGAGMIVAEPVPAHRTGVLTRGNFRAEDDSPSPQRIRKRSASSRNSVSPSSSQSDSPPAAPVTTSAETRPPG